LVQLRNQVAELLPPEPPEGPTEAEQWQQEEAQQLRKMLESLAGQLHA
jgi:hypothetical protein